MDDRGRPGSGAARRVASGLLAVVLVLCAGLLACSCAPPPAPKPEAPASVSKPVRPSSALEGRLRANIGQRMGSPESSPQALAERVFPSRSDSGAPPVVGPPPVVGSATGGSLSFLVYGDTRSNPKVHRQLVQVMLGQPGISFVAHTGDLVGDGAKASEWNTFLGIVGPIAARVPFYPALGNHDLPREMSVPALGRLQGPPKSVAGAGYYYGVDCGTVALAVLDSESLRKSDPQQVAWMRSFLGASRAPLKVVTLHRPLWSPGPNGSAPEIRKQVLPAMREVGARLLFTAHDHMYYRTVREGIVQVITAGGGAPLYEVKHPDVIQQGDVLKVTHHFVRVDVGSDAATVTALGLDGSVIDRFSLPMR